MKKTLLIISCAIVFLLVLGGCGKKDEKRKIGIPNPLVTVNGSADFAAVGLTLTAPEDAENVEYMLIDKTLAQIKFKLDGNEYNYRTAKSKEDITGIYDAYTDEEMNLIVVAGEKDTTISVKTTDKGARLAVWSWGDFAYSLYTDQKASDDTISDLAQKLAETDYPII
ncbi:MAG: hypothetical protein RSA00_07585 [Hydrogenoanaerobacterium sp.]